MKSSTMLFSLLIFSLTLAACGQQSVSTPTSVNITISVQVEPEPLAVGDTTLIVTLKDGSGSPVDGATLQVHGNMDHEGMMPIDREVSQSANGEYRVPFEWSMGGGWIVQVTAQLPDGAGEVSQSFDFFVEAVSSESIINRDSDTENTTVNVGYESDNDPAVGGDAIVTIILTDENDRPITDAIVEVTGDMAHPGMMPISGKGEHIGDGHYTVPLRWTMAGDWIITVKVMLADGSIIEKTFDQQVITQAG